MKKYYLLIVALICLANLAFSQTYNWDLLFKDPPAQYKPMPLWHLNGQLSDTVIDRQMKDVKYASNFGGVTVLPVSGTTPKYLSQDYWNFFGRILQDAKKLDLDVIWYDDVDYPSGSAGGEFKKAYPDDIRKILTRKDSVIPGNTIIEMSVPSGRLMSAVAMNTTSKARIDIRPFVNNRLLKWKSPAGEWKVMTFTCDVASPKLGEDDLRVDYLDPQAVEKYVNYFFSNSTDDTVNTFVQVRGKIIPQLWNPYNGTISRIDSVSYIKEGNDRYTRIPLKLGAVQSTFIIAKSPGKED